MKSQGYANIVDAGEEDAESEEEGPSAGIRGEDIHCATGHGHVPMGLPRPRINVSEFEPEPQAGAAASRLRRKKPAPLPLHRTQSQSTAVDVETYDDDNAVDNIASPSPSLNIAKFFNPHTGRLKDDIILHPATGLDALCEPAPRLVSFERRCAAVRPSSVGEWAGWAVDWGVEWVQRWLEGAGSAGGDGGGEYQIVPAEEDDIRITCEDGDGIELGSMVS